MAAYQRAVVDPLGVVYVFSTATGYNGNLGGRSGADAKCQAKYDSSYTHLNCANVRAFISVDYSDEIRDMPGNYGVPTSVVIYGPTGKRIAQNWADLLDGSIELTMQQADVESSSNYWTGATSNGGADDMNCSSWTVGDGITNTGKGGAQDHVDAGWITNAFWIGCDQPRPILCICW